MEELQDLPPVPAATLLAEIDAQQDDVLKQLDALNSRLETLLAGLTPPKPETTDRMNILEELRRAA